MNMIELLKPEQKEDIDHLAQCLEFASLAHKDQKDRHGVPYVFHCIRVSNKGTTLRQKQLGLIHDCFEDGPQEVKDRMLEELPYELVQSLLILTRHEQERYDNYINRIFISNDVDAILVKIHDLADNCSLYRMDEQAEKRVVERYIPAYRKLQSVLKSKGIRVSVPIV